MIYGLGIDILKIKRIKNLNVLAQKVLHPEELVLLKDLPNKKSKKLFLAGRWCAKEAIFKACPALAIQSLPTINIFWSSKLEQLQVSGVDLPAHHQLYVSITHDTDYAAAVSVLNFYA